MQIHGAELKQETMINSCLGLKRTRTPHAGRWLKLDVQRSHDRDPDVPRGYDPTPPAGSGAGLAYGQALAHTGRKAISTASAVGQAGWSRSRYPPPLRLPFPL